ncbi:MAG: hypothetical protein FD181_3483 [Prolixibacteraceae bacterium]|nr:MAG: hypothetical protein FD181_3483 [Prolixibacteraceae bacterium]
MFKMSNFLQMFLIGCSVLVISGCGTGQQKKEDKNATEQKTEIAAEFVKEQSELLAKANQEVHNINQKLVELNDKIHANQVKGHRLTQAQNTEIDEIEKIRASLNPQIHQIKKVPQEQWEDFKTSFEKDIEDVKSKIDVLLNELQVK